MKKLYLFLIIPIITLIFITCFDIPAPEVQIVRSNPLGFSVPQFDAYIVDTQFTSSPYNPDTFRYYMGDYVQDTIEGEPAYLVDLAHYTDEVLVDTIIFRVRNGVEAIVDGYYVEFYRGMQAGEDNEKLYQSPKYSDLDLFIEAPLNLTDTLETYLLFWPIRVRKAVKKMYSEPFDTAWQAVQARVHFYGTDAYGDDTEFDVIKDFSLIRAE